MKSTDDSRTVRLELRVPRRWPWVLVKYALLATALGLGITGALRRFAPKRAGFGGVGRPPLSSNAGSEWPAALLLALGAVCALALVAVQAWACGGWRVLEGVRAAPPPPKPKPKECPACPACPAERVEKDGSGEHGGVNPGAVAVSGVQRRAGERQEEEEFTR